jgi:hypothetical protein
MRRWAATCAAVVLLVSAILHADVTVSQTITIEGAAAALMGGNAAPRVVMRFKGTKVRTETEAMGQTTVVLADLATKQTIMLNAADKTARIVEEDTAPGAKAPPTPEMDVSFKPTGQKRTIDAMACDEYAFAMTVGMSDKTRPGTEVPPEAAQMLQDVKMLLTGSIWIAKSGPGIAEFVAFQKAAVEANMLSAVSGGMARTGNGLDKVMAAAVSAQGLPYLSEITTNVEGTGQMVEMMKQMGAMKIINKVTAISTEALSDDLFKVPAGYTMVK